MTTIDIIILVVFAFYIIFGLMKGFIRSVVNLIGGIASFVISSIGASILAPVLSQSIIEPFFGEFINSTIRENTALDKVDTQFTNLSDTIREILSGMGINTEEQLLATSNPVDTLMDAITSSIANSISHLICFLLLFIACNILVLVLAKGLEGIAKMLFLGGINKFLGGVFGALTAFVIISFVFFISSKLPQEFIDNIDFLTPTRIEESIIGKEIYRINLIGMFIE